MGQCIPLAVNAGPGRTSVRGESVAGAAGDVFRQRRAGVRAVAGGDGEVVVVVAPREGGGAVGGE